ncbi:MAG: ABC-F family ATP-binding cassette domain-containing protein [Acidimicrobiia bacterium]
MFVVKDLRIDVGPVTLMDGVSFSVQPGDKVGLVGRNGAGKSTLIKTLVGYLPASSGSVVRSGNLGYFSQESEPPDLERSDLTALERILAARQIGAMLRRMEDTRRKIERLEGEARDGAIRRFARLHDEFEAKGGFVAEAEAKRVAASLGITSADLDQPIATMSGGQRRRVELARILFAETDVLLLDEPTNHLDLDAKAWLIDYLSAYRGGLLLVSHDLPLLDEAITSVLALEGGEIEAYRGNYSHYLSERERRRRQKERERRRQDDEIARLESNIRRFKGSSQKMARVARSMESRVERMRRELVEVQRRGKTVSVAFPQPEPSGQTPISAHGLAKSYGDNLVFVDVDVDTNRGERILILGLNGAGKTTLLRILAGIESPDLGSVELGHKTTVGYYAQEHEQIVAGRSVLDHLRQVSDQPDQVLRTVLGHFLLADRIDQDAATLSGGEKTKLALAMLVMSRPNVLLLDEPTNNLDPQAKEALLWALGQYQGTIVLVSHDTDFVARLVPEKAIVMPEGEASFFDDSMLDLVALA